MRKIYSLFLVLLAVSFAGVTAQNQLKKTIDSKLKIEKKQSKKRSLLRSDSQAVFYPDSVYIYSGKGKLIAKTYLTVEEQGRKITQREHEWSDSLNMFVFNWSYTEVFDERGNSILDEERFLENDGIWRGYKYECRYNSANEEIYRTSSMFNSVKNDYLTYSYWQKKDTVGGYLIISENLSYDENANIDYGNKGVTYYLNGDLVKTSHDYIWNKDQNKWESSGSYLEFLYYGSISEKPESRVTSRKYISSSEISYEYKIDYKYEGNNIVEEEHSEYRYTGYDEYVPVLLYKKIYDYDSNNNMILDQQEDWESENNIWRKAFKSEFKFDERGNELSFLGFTSDWNLNEWKESSKRTTKYDAQDREIFSENYYMAIEDSIPGVEYWKGSYKYKAEYSEKGFQTLYEDYRWDDARNRWTYDIKEVLELDKNGNPTLMKEYEWVDGKWMLEEYHVAFPYSPENVIEAEETQPVNDDGNENNFEGTITLGLNIPTDAVPTGSFNVTLPQGLTLDESTTQLSETLTSKANLNISGGENNTYTFVITEKGYRSASDVVYKNILNIVYKVDENVAGQEHEIVVKDIQFALSTGGVVEQSELKVKVTPKNITGIENEKEGISCVSLINGTLTVDTPFAETISVYTLDGVNVYTASKNEGLAIYNIPYVKGFVIVKGSAGWVSKVVVK